VAVHGDADAFVDVASADAAAAWFAAAHGCGEAARSQPASDVRLDAYRRCRQGNGTRLDYLRVGGGGHTLPGAPLVWSGLGRTSSFDGFAAICRSWEAAAADAPPAEAPPTALLAGLVVGALAAAVLAVLMCVAWRRRRMRGGSPSRELAGGKANVEVSADAPETVAIGAC